MELKPGDNLETDKEVGADLNQCLNGLYRCLESLERISNKQLWQKISLRLISSLRLVSAAIKVQKWRWIAHTFRRGPQNITSQALDSGQAWVRHTSNVLVNTISSRAEDHPHVMARRKRGQPKTRAMDIFSTGPLCSFRSKED
ncbi:hypothetical protein AAFF_G00388310 [Aldrovandia affinis]|uniref:Uncharacterized protein n=1 Tax=Aldrovandia affinis TaxID=143900 RepID=A0AAD7WM97_9TELE|nr:hypothetical protein AAFF_G00388310 [Aldrovandia affinis]